jgi:CheY-like chemotaxis protein
VPEITPTSRLISILLVDYQDTSRIAMKWFLDTFGFEVVSVRNAEEALTLFDARIHDVIITDNSMEGMTGAELAHVIKLRSPSTPVLMYTGAPPGDCSRLDRVILKPAHLLTLKDAVEELVTRRHM